MRNGGRAQGGSPLAQHRSRSILGIACFYLVAFGVSFAAGKLPAWKVGSVDLRLILCGFGPLSGGVVAYLVFRTRNAAGLSIWGPRPLVAVALPVLAVICYALTDTKHSLVTSLSLAMTQLVYCFGEEFGWRHYLQNATHQMNEWLRALIMGVLWFFWHFSFLDKLPVRMLGQDMSMGLFAPLMIAILALLSLLFGKLVLKTKSVLFPTTAHFIPRTNLITLLVAGAALLVSYLYWHRLAPRSSNSSG